MFCFGLLQVKLDVYLAELTKIGKSQKYTLSVDVEGGRLVVMKKVKDSQEDWTTFTHDKSNKDCYDLFNLVPVKAVCNPKGCGHPCSYPS